MPAGGALAFRPTVAHGAGVAGDARWSRVDRRAAQQAVLGTARLGVRSRVVGTVCAHGGVAAWLVWRSPGSKAAALGLFGAQLAANARWSWLFFAWHRGTLAAVEVLVLLALIVVATVVDFWRTSRLAALLLVPYFLWVSFASVLTWAVWRSDPGLL